MLATPCWIAALANGKYFPSANKQKAWILEPDDLFLVMRKFYPHGGPKLA
jgi:hypothetical protein